MNPTVAKITQLLDSDDLHLRIAAIRVVAEIGLKGKQTVQALGRCLQEPHDELRIEALRALARLGARDVISMVVPLLLTSGPLREQAMAVITAVGPSVIKQLKVLYPQADFHGKRAVITVLARIGGKDAIAFLLKILPTEPFEIQKHLTFSISEALDRMTPAAQTPIFTMVVRLLKDKRLGKHPQIVVTVAVLLGRFKGPTLAGRARAQLKQLAEKKYAPEIRRHALLSFGRLLGEGKTAPADLQFLFKGLCDDDWHNVAQHALAGLQRLPLEEKVFPRLIELLHRSPHFSVHIHIFERLQNSDRPDVAQAILPFLADSRFRVREAAEVALRKMPTSIESLFQLLMKTEDLEVTQRINAILRDFPQETRVKYVDRAVKRLLSLFESNDPHYKSFLEFVKGLDPQLLRKRIYEKVHALKKSRSRERWERIAALVQLLWDNHLITAEGRYLLAVALVRLSAKDLAPAARRANLGLRVIRSLIYDDFDELVKRLKTDKDLKPEDYYYLGFHFAEEGDDMRPFATTMLEHLAKKHPTGSAGKHARHKLELMRRAESAEAGGEKTVEAGKGAKGPAASPKGKPVRKPAAAAKAPARKAPAAKTPAKKAPAKKAPAKKTPAKKAPAKKTPARRAPAPKRVAASKKKPTSRARTTRGAGKAAKTRASSKAATRKK